MKKIKYRRYLELAMPILLGMLAFFIVVGQRVLDVTNIAWLKVGDPSMYFLGWQFFRKGNWSFPVGVNPDYGLELSTSIVYSDSNPLGAFLFKPFNDILPQTFQYFGIWLFACFLLQAWFGWKLVGLATEARIAKFAAAGLFVFSPPMLFRLTGHYNLVGQFFILAALYLAFRPMQDNRRLLWIILLAATAMVHAYLLAMIAIIWLADIVRLVMQKEKPAKFYLYELFLGVTVVGLLAWQAGYFVVGTGVAAGGYGYYRMNLLSVFDPSGWSYILKDIPEEPGEYEGFNFLGIGVILLIIFLIPVLHNSRDFLVSVCIRYRVFLLALVALTVFALSNKLGVATQDFEVPLPKIVIRVADIFRSSGRMFWPTFYVMLFAIIVLVLRSYEKRVSCSMLVVALLVQAADTSAGWLAIRHHMMSEPSSKWSTPLRDSFWKSAAKRYSKVRFIMPRNHAKNWRVFADYAASNNLGTDTIYLARVNPKGMQAAQSRARDSLDDGRYDSDSLYILSDSTVGKAALSVRSHTDLLARIDGFNVLAPGWKVCQACPQVANELNIDDVFKPLFAGESIFFSQVNAGQKYLLNGWSSPEQWGVWSDGKAARLILPVSFVSGNPRAILLNTNAFVTPAHPKQTINILVNGIPVVATTLTQYAGNRIIVPIPGSVLSNRKKTIDLYLDFRLPDAARPVDVSVNPDTRELALGLISIKVL